MKKATARRLLALMAVPAIALQTGPANAISNLSDSANTKGANTLQENPANKQTSEFYQQARTDMEGALGRVGEDYYAIYRMVERIARANELDEQPWRIRVSTQDVFNAYASDLNMLTFEGGLFEQLSGDTAAIACVVGHEMAHHTKGHIPEHVEVEAQLVELQEQALEDARAEVESANRTGSIFGSVIGAVTGVVGGNTRSRSGRIATGVTGDILQGLNESQTNQAMVRAEEIYNERIAELDSRYSATRQENEFEADMVGYEYIVRAGFEPAGCLRAMGALNRTATSRLPGITHPKPEDRVDAISALNTAATNQSLISEGEANLSRSPNPLEYGVGRDGSSLRVESRFGSRDIDDGFPQ
ncbi:MAG: M48 family metalloprotease [Cyanobacteria bacterium P01_F01_bin.53]